MEFGNSNRMRHLTIGLKEQQEVNCLCYAKYTRNNQV